MPAAERVNAVSTRRKIRVGSHVWLILGSCWLFLGLSKSETVSGFALPRGDFDGGKIRGSVHGPLSTRTIW